ncbi:MAG: adenylate kinase [bacterium]
MKNIVMLGIQGSGKGTQAELLSRTLSVPIISTGRLFRSEMEEGSELGQKIAEYVTGGELVPDELVCQAIAERVAEPDARQGFILDGFPRNARQAEELSVTLAEDGRELSDVVYIRLSESEAMNRLTGRRVCSNRKCETNFHIEFNPPQGDPEKCDRCGSPLIQRGDDRPEAIIRRFALFNSETAPLVEYYRERGLLREIDGGQSIADVAGSILEAIGD